MNNLIYLGYFLLKTDYKDLRASLRCTRMKGYAGLMLIADMLYCSLRYGSSFVDYFNFQFYRKNGSLKSTYATMGLMYRFHQTVNAPSKIDEVDSKERFAENFRAFCNAPHIFQSTEREALEAYLQSRAGDRIVWKDPTGTAGKSVRILGVTRDGEKVRVGEKPVPTFIEDAFRERGSVYIEDYIKQHESVASISPSGVNTIRVITLLDPSGEAKVIGSVFRISVNSHLDNYSAGNLAAEVDPETGEVITGGIRKRSACDVYHDHHPVTGAVIKGFRIPYWEKVLETVTSAAKVVPAVRSIGWDVAITPNGPILIEGNSKWNKDTWQIPADRGKRAMIESCLQDA